MPRKYWEVFNIHTGQIIATTDDEDEAEMLAITAGREYDYNTAHNRDNQ